MLLFVGAVGVLASNDAGPLPPVYSSCAAMLFVAATWFTVALVSVEDPTHRAITTVSAGGTRRVLAATVAVAVLGGVVMSVFGLVLPLVFGDHPLSAVDLVVGTEAQLTCAVVGVAIGLVCSGHRRPLRRTAHGRVGPRLVGATGRPDRPLAVQPAVLVLMSGASRDNSRNPTQRSMGQAP